MDIPKVIKTKRFQMGLTQEKFAKLLGKKRSTVTLYEAGKIMPPGDILIKIMAFEAESEHKLPNLRIS